MKKTILRIFIIIAVLFLSAWLLMPSYLSKALVYQKPGIEDYSLFANRTIKKGVALPWAIHKDYNKIRLSDSMIRQFNEYGTVAYIVIKNDSILHEEYWDGYSDSSFSNSFSMAKSIVSLLIGCLLDDGKIKNLDEPITRYITEYKGPEYNKITIRDLLTMSSGLNWDESYSTAFSITTKAYYGDDLPKLIRSLTPIEAPGTIHRYKSGDTQLLSMIVERASGKHLADYASEKLWKPLGAEHDALWSLDKQNGNEKAYCCFNSNARDFARIGEVLLDSGRFNGKQVVSKDYIRQATSPAVWLKDDKGAICDYYGYQIWMLNYKGMKVNYARGILGQYIFVIPEKHAVIVRLGHKRSDKNIGVVPTDVFLFLDAALKLL